MEFSITELLKRIKLPTSKKDVSEALEAYLASRGIQASCKASSLSGTTLYLKTDPAVRNYIFMHKEEALLFIKERFPEHHIGDIL